MGGPDTEAGSGHSADTLRLRQDGGHGAASPRRDLAMSKTVTGALLAALFFSTSASAQDTCRAADITSDGQVSAPDFTALSICYGQPATSLPP